MSSNSNASCQSEGLVVLTNSNNGSICSCNPGFFLMTISNGWNRCANFSEICGPANSSSILEPSKSAPILSGFSVAPNSFIWTTCAIVGLWLLLTIPLLFAPMNGFWFRLRHALTTWDKRFSLRHWVDDRKCLLKRSTDVGGIMSVASWMLFAGLASGLVYEAISSDTVTIQDLTPAKRDDIQMFRNDIEINITTVGQLQCSQIVESKLSLSGDNGYMVNASAEDFQKPVCVDTMKGPLVRVSCKSCIITSDKYLFTWEFQDQLNANLTASAVGFEIHASATAFLPHKSSLIAIIPAGSNVPSPLAATLRGSDWNVIGLNFVPRIFKSKGDLKLIQIMFHMFTSGSYVVTMKEMQDALAKQQGVRVALQVNVLSQYLVATTYRSYFGIVKFLAYLGGLYVLCRFLFLIILLQCESIFSKLLYEEKLLNKVVAKERARAHWAKVRIFVKHAKLSNVGKYQVPKKQYPLCDSVKSGHSPTEGTSGAGNYVDKKVIQSRFLVRQYRKPPWIHEQEALPPVPEPPYFVDHPNYEGERVAFLENAHEYLQSMYNYSARLRRDYLTTVAVLDKVGWYFGLHKN